MKQQEANIMYVANEYTNNLLSICSIKDGIP